MPKRVLVVSTPGLLEQIRDRKINKTRLARALFYLGGTREEANNVPEGTLRHIFLGCSIRKRRRNLNTLSTALSSAEQDNRVVYRKPDGVNTFVELNQFLESHQLNPVQPGEKDFYGYDAAKRLIEAANPGLRVIA